MVSSIWGFLVANMKDRGIGCLKVRFSNLLAIIIDLIYIYPDYFNFPQLSHFMQSYTQISLLLLFLFFHCLIQQFLKLALLRHLLQHLNDQRYIIVLPSNVLLGSISWQFLLLGTKHLFLLDLYVDIVQPVIQFSDVTFTLELNGLRELIDKVLVEISI